MQAIIDKILKRAFVRDIIEAISFVIIFSPILILIIIEATWLIKIIAVIIYINCLYWIFIKSIQKIYFEDEQIKIINLFKINSEISYIKYSSITKIDLYSTPKGSSGIVIYFILNDNEKKFTINGAGCTKENKGTLMGYFKAKKSNIIFNGF